MINVLYVNFASENLDGATLSLMDLIDGVKNNVHPIVLLRSKGKVFNFFEEHGIECIIQYFIEDAVAKPQKPHQFIKYAVKYLPTLHKYSKINNQCIKEICEELRGRKISVVHTNNTVLDIGYYLANALGAKHVWHLRGFMDLGLGWMPLKGWKDYRKMLQNSDAVIGITYAVLYHYLPQNSSNAFKIFDAVKVVGNTSFVQTKEKYFLFCAGLLTEQKGYGLAVEAFALSGLYKKGYRLRVIGSPLPKYSAIVQKIIEKYNISEYVDHLGRLSDVSTHFENATAFLMCSQNEGLGRVTVEAMLYGCPVIGRASGGTKEIVISGQSGYQFDTAKECADLMKQVADSDNTHLIRQAQEFAVHNFSIEDYGDKIMNVYNTILNKETVI